MSVEPTQPVTDAIRPPSGACPPWCDIDPPWCDIDYDVIQDPSFHGASLYRAFGLESDERALGVTVRSHEFDGEILSGVAMLSSGITISADECRIAAASFADAAEWLDNHRRHVR